MRVRLGGRLWVVYALTRIALGLVWRALTGK